EPNNISSDPESVEDYTNDPLINCKQGTIGMGLAMIDHYSEIQQAISTISIPVLLQKGSEDVMIIGENSFSMI
ncbi:MAG: alpha/beta hydrolase, partial [Candidatus Heimdallarchaeota archaeon]|nr:alpha/beta hydrolase [Candidatus Heimdallarchaeota archaeon]